MKPGEVRTWSTPDRQYTLTRTTRPYAYDRADAYNAANAAAGRSGRWYVAINGELRLGGQPMGII